MAMEPYKVDYCDILRELVEEGKVSMSRIDDAASRALRLKYRLGLFDHPNTLLKNYPKFASKEFQKTALDAAAETMVMLKKRRQHSAAKPKHTDYGDRPDSYIDAFAQRRMVIHVAGTSDR